jgi:transcriptional regulator with XRE-family HTH domain
MQALKKDLTYKSGYPNELQKKLDMPLSDRLKQARNDKKMSAMKVVRELKMQGITIGHTSLQGYEAKEGIANHRYPSLPVLVALARFYDVSLDFLFGLSDDKNYRRPPLKEQLYRDIKILLNSDETLFYEGEQLTLKQRELLKNSLDLTLVRF